MNHDVVKQQWEREQALLGLARDTPEEEFARGGLAGLAAGSDRANHGASGRSISAPPSG